MKNKKTYYQIILDKSGSMQDCVGSTLESFNGQIAAIKAMQEKYPEQEIKVGLTTFNNHVEETILMTNPKFAPQLDTFNYHPNGGTALLDAIGATVYELKRRIAVELQNKEASVVVVVLTDGYENSSKMYSLGDIQRMIGDLEETGLWTFTYLGSTLDAVEVAKTMNFKKDSAQYFGKGKEVEVMKEVGVQMDVYMAAKKRGKIKKELLKDEDTSD